MAPADARLIEGTDWCIAAKKINPTGLLQAIQLRPLPAWYDLEFRALHQAKRLKSFVAASKDRHENNPDSGVEYLELISYVEDLENLITARLDGQPVIGVLMALEGAHWLRDKAAVAAGVKKLFKNDFRMVAPTHRFSNSLGHSSEGCNQIEGLTDLGELFLQQAEESGMVLDLAHATDKGIRDTTMSRVEPIVISHTGVRELCTKYREEKNPKDTCHYERNMAADEIKSVARNGGIIGIGFWPGAVGPGVEGIVKTFEKAYRILHEKNFVDEMKAIKKQYDPADHLAFGSDFDGAVKTPFDISKIKILTAALMRIEDKKKKGKPLFSKTALRKIAGVNACRVFAMRLPSKGGQNNAETICDRLLRE